MHLFFNSYKNSISVLQHRQKFSYSLTKSVDGSKNTFTAKLKENGNQFFHHENWYKLPIPSSCLKEILSGNVDGVLMRSSNTISGRLVFFVRHSVVALL